MTSLSFKIRQTVWWSTICHCCNQPSQCSKTVKNIKQESRALSSAESAAPRSSVSTLRAACYITGLGEKESLVQCVFIYLQKKNTQSVNSRCYVVLLLTRLTVAPIDFQMKTRGLINLFPCQWNPPRWCPRDASPLGHMLWDACV